MSVSRVSFGKTINAYTQAEEDAIALRATTTKAGQLIIYNTTLQVVREWNGSTFVTYASNEISSNISALNVSVTYQPIGSGIILLPTEGRYKCDFSGIVSNSSNTGVAYVAIFVGGVQITNSERNTTNTSANTNILSTNANVYVDGTQSIEVRWKNQSIANTSTMTNRTLSLNRLTY